MANAAPLPVDSSSLSSALATGGGSVDQEIGAMNDAFNLAIQTNLKITIAKTIDGSEETAAQQRPNIG